MLQMQQIVTGEMFWVTILLLYVYMLNTTSPIYFKSFLLFCTSTLLTIFQDKIDFENLQNLQCDFPNIDLNLPGKSDPSVETCWMD